MKVLNDVCVCLYARVCECHRYINAMHLHSCVCKCAHITDEHQSSSSSIIFLMAVALNSDLRRTH